MEARAAQQASMAGDEAGGDLAILIEEEEPVDAEGLGAADANIERGGDAEVVAVLDEAVKARAEADARRSVRAAAPEPLSTTTRCCTWGRSSCRFSMTPASG